VTALPLPGQIDPQDVVAWLTDQGMTAKASYDGLLPPSPDLLVVVAQTGGPGFSVEQAYDSVSFQLRSRGLQRDGGVSARDLAWQADFALIPPPMAAPLVPCMIGSQFVNLVTRVGGPPAFLLRDSAGRSHYVCSYIFSVARA
jgi:hypothetical protein